MRSRKILNTAIKIAAVCLLFAVCMAVGGAIAGVHRVAQQRPPAQSSPQVLSPAAQPAQAPPNTQPGPNNLMFPFLFFSICVGIASSYLILRSSWHGWMLAAAMFVGMYGISTVVTQIESIVFLSNKLPQGMLRAIFVQGAFATALFAPLAVLLLGKWRVATAGVATPTPARMVVASAVWRIAFLVIAFVFLYMFFGYFVAWQNPELRSYYSGPEWPTFLDSLKGNWRNSPWIFLLQMFRALLYIAFVYPLIRTLRAPRWKSAIVTALFLSAWTTVLLIPNPLMPASVARSHFWETLGFNLVFGTLLGWLLSLPHSTVSESVSAAR
jgi:hypothetical protein